MQNDLIDKIPDVEFLTWIRDRLVYVYGESPHVDFVRRLETIIEAKQPEQGTGEGSICVQDNPLVSPVGNDGVPSPGLVLAADVMREALEFYGDRKNYMGSLARARSAIELDNEGDIARQALAAVPGIGAPKDTKLETCNYCGRPYREEYAEGYGCGGCYEAGVHGCPDWGCEGKNGFCDDDPAPSATSKDTEGTSSDRGNLPASAVGNEAEPSGPEFNKTQELVDALKANLDKSCNPTMVAKNIIGQLAMRYSVYLGFIDSDNPPAPLPSGPYIDPKTIRCGPPREILFGDAMAKAVVKHDAPLPDTHLVETVKHHLQMLRENELFCNTDEWPENAPESVKDILEALSAYSSDKPELSLGDNDRVMDLIRAVGALRYSCYKQLLDLGYPGIQLLDKYDALPPHIIEQARMKTSPSANIGLSVDQLRADE